MVLILGQAPVREERPWTVMETRLRLLFSVVGLGVGGGIHMHSAVSAAGGGSLGCCCCSANTSFTVCSVWEIRTWQRIYWYTSYR